MIDKDNKVFEQMLVRKYENNPTPDLSEVLIKEYSAHRINDTEPTPELNNWIRERFEKIKNRRCDVTKIFGLEGNGSRPKIELAYISMNVLCWLLILQNKDLNQSFMEVSNLFNEPVEKVKIGFYRKNHDFGERELCRLGLDLSFSIFNEPITSAKKNIIKDILNEDVEIQMMKDRKHHRARFKLE